MKRILLSCLFAGMATLAFSQLNMTLLDEIDYGVSANDIWGWVDPDDGSEYALVGLTTGVSIVDVSDPENVVEVQFIPGPNSTWRDLKTWGNHVYVTNETSNGVLVVDMTNAPGDITWFDWTPNLPGLGTLNKCHNIYIDEFGYAYLAGCNLNSGGMLIIDVFSEPGTPQFVTAAPSIYSHDVYARGNHMYASEIYAGRLAIYDVEDKNNIQLLATQTTPFEFTHNAWLNDAGDVVFTTDETGNAPIGVYDISDLNNIVELDEFVPISTMGQNVIPHNVHVWDDWLIISYYTDGGIIADASKPDNVIEVGNWDTFLGGNGGFSGVWGAYPFLPSGIVLLTDIGTGLYVCGADYVRACWLEGTVTDAQTGAPIFGAEANIDSPQANFATSDLSGVYKTGQAIPGTFDVTFSANGYISKTVPATLDNGVLTILDVELEPLVSYAVSGQTIKSVDGAPVPNAQVVLVNEENEYVIVSDGNGNFTLPSVLGNDYTIYAGAWGYINVEISNITVDDTTDPIVITLEEGYRDDFAVDLGWSAAGVAATGFWELGEPVGTNFNGAASNPDFDLSDDIGDQCYVTGNGGGGAGNDDVDDGTVTLTSPMMDLTGYSNPVLSYSRWWFNAGGASTPNDALEVRLTDGVNEVVLETITASNPNWFASPEFALSDFIDLTESVQVIFETSDLASSGHLVEAAIDAFSVMEGCTLPVGGFEFTANATEVSFTNNITGATSYTWEFGDANNSTSNEENPTFSYDGPGEYTVTLSVENECGVKTYIQTITIEASATVDLDDSAFTLAASPNPFTEQLLVNYELAISFDQAEIQIFNVLGEQMNKVGLEAAVGSVSLENEINQSGVYFLQIAIDGKAGKALRVVKF